MVLSWCRYSFVLSVMSWMIMMSLSWLVRSLLQHYFQLPDTLRLQGRAAYVPDMLLATEVAGTHIGALVRFRKVPSEGFGHISTKRKAYLFSISSGLGFILTPTCSVDNKVPVHAVCRVGFFFPHSFTFFLFFALDFLLTIVPDHQHSSSRTRLWIATAQSSMKTLQCLMLFYLLIHIKSLFMLPVQE